MNNIKLNDNVIAHLVKLLQIGILTGTDVVDQFRMIRLTVEEGELFLDKEYEEKYIDIWALNDTERGNLKPGAFITAGPNGNRGIWCGITKSGSCVAAWEGNFKNNRKASEYIKDLMDYAKR